VILSVVRLELPRRVRVAEEAARDLGGGVAFGRDVREHVWDAHLLSGRRRDPRERVVVPRERVGALGVAEELVRDRRPRLVLAHAVVRDRGDLELHARHDRAAALHVERVGAREQAFARRVSVEALGDVGERLVRPYHVHERARVARKDARHGREEQGREQGSPFHAADDTVVGSV